MTTREQDGESRAKALERAKAYLSDYQEVLSLPIQSPAKYNASLKLGRSVSLRELAQLAVDLAAEVESNRKSRCEERRLLIKEQSRMAKLCSSQEYAIQELTAELDALKAQLERSFTR